jgi:hypothetical protein
MDQSLLVALGALGTAVVGVIGYLLKRWWEGQAATIERAAKIKNEIRDRHRADAD